MADEKYHWVETKVYDQDGEVIAINQSYVPGEFKPDGATLKYWAWLDKRREPSEETLSEEHRNER